MDILPLINPRFVRKLNLMSSQDFNKNLTLTQRKNDHTEHLRKANHT